MALVAEPAAAAWWDQSPKAAEALSSSSRSRGSHFFFSYWSPFRKSALGANTKNKLDGGHRYRAHTVRFLHWILTRGTPHQPAHRFASIRGSIPALLATPSLCKRRSWHPHRFRQPVSPTNRSPFGRLHPREPSITRHTMKKSLRERLFGPRDARDSNATALKKESVLAKINEPDPSAKPRARRTVGLTEARLRAANQQSWMTSGKGWSDFLGRFTRPSRS